MILVLATLALVVWIAAAGRTVLNLLLLPRLRAGAPAEGPLVSVVIPARNEERAIERTVRAFLAQQYHRLEIIVLNDRSTDATETILTRLAADQPRLHVIHGRPPPAGWLGKPWALHQGSRAAHGELLLFVDADILYAPGAVAAAVARIRDTGAGMVTLMPFVEMAGFWEHIAMPMLGVTVFTIVPTWLSNRSRAVALALGGGTGSLVRRAEYDRAGGHERIRAAVVDDIALGRLLRRAGSRTELACADELARLRMYHGAGEIIEGFTKNMFAVLGRSYAAAAFWFAFGVVCNILPYALAVTGNVPALCTVAIITATRLVLFHQLRYRLDNAVLGHPLMMAFWLWVLLRSTWMTGVRKRIHWRGRVYDAAGARGG